MGIRKAYLEGNLTRDPEVRVVGEWSVISFSIACNESRKKKDGTGFEDRPHFFNCEYWSKNPQYWLKNMAKGKGIVGEFEVIQDRWDDNGQQRQAIKFKLVSPPVLRSSAQNNMDKTPEQPQDFKDDIPF